MLPSFHRHLSCAALAALLLACSTLRAQSSVTVSAGSGSGSSQTVTANSNLGATPTTAVASTSTITTSGNAVVLTSGSSITFQAGSVIYLEPGFQAVTGSFFHALIGAVSSYTLTVTGGTGSNTGIVAGTQVQVSAAAPPSGQAFSNWTLSGVGSLANPNYATTTFTMGAGAATLTANYVSTVTTPSVTTQPQNQTAVAGGNATFSVTASGTPPLTYQWLKNGTNISGAVSSTLTLTNVQSGDSGSSYTVVVANSYGSVTSNAATLTVNTPPTIVTQPQSHTVAGGTNVTFTAIVSGSPAPTCQWQRQPAGTSGFSNLANSVTYSGAGTATLTITGVTVGMSGDQFLCVVTNTVGSVNSSAATLTVNASQGDTNNQNQLNIHLPISP